MHSYPPRRRTTETSGDRIDPLAFEVDVASWKRKRIKQSDSERAALAVSSVETPVCGVSGPWAPQEHMHCQPFSALGALGALGVECSLHRAQVRNSICA